MAKILALDIDAVWDGKAPRERAVAGLKNMRENGYKIVWVTNDTQEYVRSAEPYLGVRKSPVFTMHNIDRLGLEPGQTVFAPGDVDCLLGTRDESLMILFMMVLPCETYVRYTGPESLDFMFPPEDG